MDRWRDVAKHGFSLKGTSTGTAKLPTFSPQESAVDNTSPNQDDNAADREYNGISRALSVKIFLQVHFIVKNKLRGGA